MVVIVVLPSTWSSIYMKEFCQLNPKEAKFFKSGKTPRCQIHPSQGPPSSKTLTEGVFKMTLSLSFGCPEHVSCVHLNVLYKISTLQWCKIHPCQKPPSYRNSPMLNLLCQNADCNGFVAILFRWLTFIGFLSPQSISDRKVLNLINFVHLSFAHFNWWSKSVNFLCIPFFVQICNFISRHFESSHSWWSISTCIHVCRIAENSTWVMSI